jgi:predicted nuclease of predicted toxin-antitoxin system
VKLLFDQNLSYRLCRALAGLFPESEQVTRARLDQANDLAIWEYARRGGLTIVTHDADFAEIAALRGPPPKVVWLRCGNQPTTTVEHLLRKNAEIIRSFGADASATCLELY